MTGLHAHLGVKDDYDTWVNAVKGNEEYLRGLHNSMGVKDEYEDWYSAVWGDASKKKDDGESPSEEVELVGVSPSELPSIDEQIERLRGLRGSDVRIIEGQDPSSVMMGTSEADGRFFAHPTLFPRDPDGVTQSREEDWLQLEGNEAFDEAMRRGELFEFASEEEADLFFQDLSGAIIQDDVFMRLLTFPNVLITAHQAFFTQEALDNIVSTTLDNVTTFERTGRCNNAVTASMMA